MKYILQYHNAYKVSFSIYSMVEETNWTYIRIKKPTAKRLQILKAQLEADMYDDVVDLLLSNYTFKPNTLKEGRKLK